MNDIPTHTTRLGQKICKLEDVERVMAAKDKEIESWQKAADNPAGEWMKSVDVEEHVRELMVAIGVRVEAKDKQIEELRAVNASFKVEASYALTKYSEWLENHGYMDSDWWCELPNAVDEFLETEMNKEKSG